jgi:hypothetical protein
MVKRKKWCYDPFEKMIFESDKDPNKMIVIGNELENVPPASSTVPTTLYQRLNPKSKGGDDEDATFPAGRLTLFNLPKGPPLFYLPKGSHHFLAERLTIFLPKGSPFFYRKARLFLAERLILFSRRKVHVYKIG